MTTMVKVKKVKCSRYRPGVTQRLGRGIPLLFMTAALEGGEWSAARRGRTLPPGKTHYPFYRRLGGPQRRSGRREKSRPQWDFFYNNILLFRYISYIPAHM